jgi:hypothetical protein
MRYRSLTYTGVYESKKEREKPNDVYFEIRKRRKNRN